MKRKLPFLMMAFLPLLAFGQTTQSKASVHPRTTIKKPIKPVASKIVAKAPVAYCAPFLDCTDGDLIINVNFAGINNETTCSTAGYGDFTAISTSTELLAGNSYPISVKVFNGTWPHEDVAVWVDYNKNDTFDADEYTYIGNKSVSGVSLTGNIAIPEGTANGDYKMRVRVAADGPESILPTMACDEEQGYGETEDYTITIGAIVIEGCLDAPNDLYPSATYNPTCDGKEKSITSFAWLGEYSNVNLAAGTEYTFSTSDTSYFITIGNADGTTVLAAGTGSVTYTPTTSGVVRFYSHLDDNCGAAETFHSRSVKCGTPPPPPLACTDFKVLSNNLENGLFFAGEYSQRLAIDIPVGNTAFTIEGIEPTVVGTATNFSFIIYDDNGDLPGTQLATRTGTITGSTITGNNFGYDFIKYTVMFDSPYTFSANTKYWIEVTSDAAAWESTTATELGSPDAFYNDDTSGNWATDDENFVFNLICANLAVNDVSNSKVSFYPNPVKDMLTINSKNKIETVHVYNIAGQKMQISSKVNNGQIDMSRLAPGTYIVSAILEGGKNESFKVIKK